MAKLSKEEREETINHVIAEIKDSLDDMNLEYEIYGRAKHYYSIYRKMAGARHRFQNIYRLPKDEYREHRSGKHESQ